MARAFDCVDCDNDIAEHAAHVSDFSFLLTGTTSDSGSDDETSFPVRQVSARVSIPLYCAPEIPLSRGLYDSKADVWALGCLLAEVLCCCDPEKVRAHAAGGREMCLFQFCGQLPSMDDLVPLLLNTMVLRDDDIEHVTPHTAKITAAAAERFRRAGWENFDKFGCGAPHAWVDIAERYPVPSNMGSDDATVFLQLRSIMMQMLMFDPTHRLSAEAALKILSRNPLPPTAAQRNASPPPPSPVKSPLPPVCNLNAGSGGAGGGRGESGGDGGNSSGDFWRLECILQASVSVV